MRDQDYLDSLEHGAFQSEFWARVYGRRGNQHAAGICAAEARFRREKAEAFAWAEQP